MRRAIALATAQKSYAINRANENEVTWQPLYDFQTYPAAGATILTFFQVQNGQAGKTLADTNMDQPGSLPAPKKHLTTGIEIVFFPGNAPGSTGLIATTGQNWTDVWSVFKSGFLRLYVGSKDQVIDAPLGVFPPSFRLAGAAALTGVGAAAGSQNQIDYASFAGAQYDLTPLFIPPVQNFRVTLEFPVAVALPSGVAGRIGVRLLGYLYKLSQ